MAILNGKLIKNEFNLKVVVDQYNANKKQNTQTKG